MNVEPFICASQIIMIAGAGRLGNFTANIKYQLPCGEQSYGASTIFGPGVVYSDDCYSLSRI